MAEVQFDCTGVATGKMRNEMTVRMIQPAGDDTAHEIATDEGKIHGGAASAPPPLALFVASLTGCLMTQMRAFAKRLDVELRDLRVETRVFWDWTMSGRVYESAPKTFEIDIYLDSPEGEAALRGLVETAKKGCFVEQTLATANMITHRIKVGDDWIRV